MTYGNTLSAAEQEAEIERLLSGARAPRITDEEDAAQIATQQAARERAEALEAARGLQRPSATQRDVLTPSERADVARLIEDAKKNVYRA